MTIRTPDNGASTIAQVHVRKETQTYRVVFSDMSETICTGDCMWMTKTASKEPCLRTTEDIMRMMEQGARVYIPVCGPVGFEGAYNLRIRPYTFGAIMGDGCTLRKTIFITKQDMELFDRIREDGYTLKRYYEGNPERTPVFALKDFAEEREWLGTMGLQCRGHRKYVPAEYKYASIEDRICLIQGLMDTDGYVDKNGNCSFCSTSKRLAKDMQWLIRSVGGKASITSKIPSYSRSDGTKKKCRRAYNVNIRVPDPTILFTIPRKKNRTLGKRVVMDGFHPGRRIVRIEDNGVRDMRCIEMPDDGAMYITKDFVVVHGVCDNERTEKVQ